MHVRKRLLAMAAALAGVVVPGCGGAGAPAVPSAAVSLPAGDYRFAVYSAGIGCFASTFAQGAAPNSAASLPVIVTPDGDGWRVSARNPAEGTLAMRLSRTAVGVDGAVWGTVAQPLVSVTLQHDVSGTANGPSVGVIGSIEGAVNYAGPTGTVFCATNLWSLTGEGQ